MSIFETIDFFTDQSLVPDPHPYFDYLRSKSPVLRLPHHNVVAITGWEEANAVYKDTDTFSNCVALGGPFPPLPRNSSSWRSARRHMKSSFSFSRLGVRSRLSSDRARV